jgi:hypothetical protein
MYMLILEHRLVDQLLEPLGRETMGWQNGQVVARGCKFLRLS